MLDTRGDARKLENLPHFTYDNTATKYTTPPIDYVTGDDKVAAQHKSHPRINRVTEDITPPTQNNPSAVMYKRQQGCHRLVLSCVEYLVVFAGRDTSNYIDVLCSGIMGSAQLAR